MTATPILHRGRTTRAALAFLLAIAACSDDGDDDDDEAVAPDTTPVVWQHPELSDEQVTRLIDALNDLAAAGMEAADPKRIDAIARNRGFDGMAEMMQVHTYVGLAMQRIELGAQGGFGDMGGAARLAERLRELQREAAANEANATLPPTERNVRRVELRRQIAEIEDQLDDEQALALDVQSQLAGIPEESLAVVRRHRDALLQAFALRLQQMQGVVAPPMRPAGEAHDDDGESDER